MAGRAGERLQRRAAVGVVEGQHLGAASDGELLTVGAEGEALDLLAESLDHDRFFLHRNLAEPVRVMPFPVAKAIRTGSQVLHRYCHLTLLTRLLSQLKP